MIIIIFIILAL